MFVVVFADAAFALEQSSFLFLLPMVKCNRGEQADAEAASLALLN